MGSELADIQPLQKPAQLPRIDLYDLLPTLWPSEKMLFQTLVPQAKSVSVPVQDLNHIAATVAKDKQMTGERVQIHLIFYQNRQTVDGQLRVQNLCYF